MAAYRESAERVLRATSRATREVLSTGDSRRNQLRLAVEKLMLAIQSEPDAARVLFVEGLSGTPRLREESLRVLARMESRTEEAIDSISSVDGVIDVPAIALVGAVRNMVSRRLRIHGEDQMLRIVDPLVDWIISYRLPPGHERWTNDERSLMPVDTAPCRGRRAVQTDHPQPAAAGVATVCPPAR